MATASSLGNTAPSSDAAAPKLLESDDPIVAMHKPQLTGQWSREQVQAWLSVVFLDSSAAVDVVLNAIDEKLSTSTSQKRKHASSIFGTTTMANRNKRYQQKQTHSSGLTPGQALVRLAVDSLKIDDGMKIRLKAALRMRHTYETLLAEREHALELQTRRLNAESAARVPTSNLPVSDTSSSEAIAESLPVTATAGDEDDLIASVLRVATEVSTEEAAEEEPKKIKRGRGSNIRFSVVEG